MSRLGRKPIPLPKGVTLTVAAGGATVKGPKGELHRSIPEGVTVKLDAGAAPAIVVTRDSDEREHRARHGLMRALLANMVKGVTDGFERKLEINGVGYRAEVAGQKLTMALGYSHPIVYELPKGIGAKVEKNLVTLTGSDRELLGETAAKVRSFRPPEPYKGKGVKYLEETIRRKVGKTGAS
jgi:large subunit ribosomal protein L6